MKLNEDERIYIQLLSERKTFKEMAIELGMTVDEVREFGDRLVDRMCYEHDKRIN